MSDNPSSPPLYRIRRMLYPAGYRWVVARFIPNPGGSRRGVYLAIPRKDGTDPAFPTWAEAMADVEARLRRKSAHRPGNVVPHR